MLPLLICLLLQDSGSPAEARSDGAKAGKLVASKEPGWPQWRGPRRDGICDEKGLLQSWPHTGPRLLWKAEGLGRGWSSPVISNGTIVLTGDEGEDLVIHALDLDGKPKWKTTNGKAWTGEYPGARSTGLYDEGAIYHLNAHGRLVRLDAATGKEVWAVDILKRFEAKNILWGLAECLIADGPRLIVTPGGKKAAMAALDKKTGETVWASEPILENLGTGYGSPILFELDGKRHLVNCTARHVFGVDADTGRGLWKRPRPSEYIALCFTPTFCGDGVLVTTPGKNGGTRYRLDLKGEEPKVEVVWNTSLDTLQGGIVRVGDLLYGSGYMGFKGWAALDFATGKVEHHSRTPASGAVLVADGRLYVLSEQGEMALLKPAPDAFEFAGRFKVAPDRTEDAWTHPVILDGRLYVRFHETLYCYELRKP